MMKAVSQASRSTPLALDGSYLTTIQVSVSTGIPKNTLARWRKDGRGPRFVKHGKRIAYPANELEAWQMVRRQEQDAMKAWGLGSG